MKIYVRASSLAESIVHQRNVPKYILNNPSVNKVLAILKECKDSVPDIQSKLEMFYRRPNQPSVQGENVIIRLCPDVDSVPGDGWSDSDWVSEFNRQSDILYNALSNRIRDISILPEVVYVSDNTTHAGPYIELKILNNLN